MLSMSKGPTKRQLERFVRIRNKSPFNSNFQFQIDLETVGLKVADIGTAVKIREGVYEWRLANVTLVEDDGELSLRDAPGGFICVDCKTDAFEPEIHEDPPDELDGTIADGMRRYDRSGP